MKFTGELIVKAPREEVFDYLADIANHPEFSDHYLKDWRLTRVDSVGQGAGARVNAKHPALAEVLRAFRARLDE